LEAFPQAHEPADFFPSSKKNSFLEMKKR
jgi:hypothetical protein